MNVRAGSLKHNYSKWEKITNDTEVLSTILGFYIPFHTKPVQIKEPLQREFSRVEQLEIRKCIDHLLAIGAVAIVSPCKSQFLSTIFIVPKPDGKWRFILNLKELYKYVDNEKFKMEDYRLVKRLLFHNSFMAKIDLKDAYYLIPIARSHKQYLRFCYNNIYYEFNCLPFGLCCAPRIFTKVMRPVVNQLRRKGYTSVIYLDDMLLLEDNYSRCLESVDATRELLLELGLTVNLQKSELIPVKEIRFLGFMFNSANMTLSLPKTKEENLCMMIQKAIKKRTLSILDTAALVGSLIAASPAVPYSMIYTKQIELEKQNALLKNKGDYDSHMTLSDTSLEDLNWWLNKLRDCFTKIHDNSYDFEIYSDASTSGWGTYYNGMSTRGFWSEEEQKLHINTLELKAILNSIMSIFRDSRNISILVRVDSTTAIAYVNKFGGCRSLVNLKVAKMIWKWCEEKEIFIYCTYINTKLNFHADKASREIVDKTDFALDISSFESICQILGTPDIDMFATVHTRKCKRYCSWFPDPECEMVDAFSVKWTDFFYAFPPFSLIVKVLRKIYDDKARGIVVVPDWSTQAWFPMYNKLCESEKVYLKKGRFRLLFPYNRRSHPLEKSIVLIAAVLSGQH